MTCSTDDPKQPPDSDYRITQGSGSYLIWKILGHGIDYVRREVKLEMGTLTDQQPTGRYPIAPMVASVFVPLFSDWQCEVVALELQRTFWERATILAAH